MGIALEVMPDEGAPQVGITVTYYPDATVRVTVEWTVDGGHTWTAVRGLDRTTINGPTFVRHHTPPLNVATTYRITMPDGDDPAPDPVEATITVPSATAWIQDPLNPRLAVPINLDGGLDEGGTRLAYGSLISATYKQQRDTVVPMGGTRPVASVGRRMLAGEVPLVLTHDVAAEAGLLRNLLLNAGAVTLRGLPDGLLEPVAHVLIGDFSERRSLPHLAAGQIATFDLKVEQVAPPALRVVVPWWTYDRVKDLYSSMTYDEAIASRPGDTYLDWLRNPEPV